MRSKYEEFYNLERLPIAYYGMCNFGGIAILDIVDELDTYVIVADYYEKPENIRKHKVYTTFKGDFYFVRCNRRFYLDEFTDINFFGGGKL